MKIIATIDGTGWLSRGLHRAGTWGTARKLMICGG